jgi:hypothetical protein
MNQVKLDRALAVAGAVSFDILYINTRTIENIDFTLVYCTRGSRIVNMPFSLLPPSSSLLPPSSWPLLLFPSDVVSPLFPSFAPTALPPTGITILSDQRFFLDLLPLLHLALFRQVINRRDLMATPYCPSWSPWMRHGSRQPQGASCSSLQRCRSSMNKETSWHTSSCTLKLCVNNKICWR